MSEAKGEPTRTALGALAARLSGASNRGWFRLDYGLLDCALGLWLAYAFAVFRGHEGGAPIRFAAAFGLAGGLAWCLTGGHGRWRGGVAQLGGGIILAGLLALAAPWIAARTIGVISWPAAWWLAAATSLGGSFVRVMLGRFHAQPGGPAFSEAARWLVLFSAAVVLVWPFYTHRPIGAGDAYWYDMMLSDFVSQVRAGQFPVWAGATEYAFNGAVSPVRLAPWFQHFGALLDLLTAQTLTFLSLKNLVMALNQQLIGFSTYFFLRAVLPRQPLLACAAALTCLASPAVLTPVFGGDQYMTFVALPFLPAVCYGLWRVARTNDITGHLALGAGVSALWLAHPPIAFWTSVAATLAYGVKLLAWRGPRVPAYIALGAAVFAVLGSFPLVSVLLLENTLHTKIPGGSAVTEIAKSFPGTFLPFAKDFGTAADNQPGYAILYVLLWAAAWLPLRRRPGALLLFSGVVLLFVLFVPVPFLNAWIWEKMPNAIMAMTNVWPMQRLVPIWAFFVIFLFAAVHREEQPGPRRWPVVLFLLGLAPMLAWSGSQASRLIVRSYGSVPRDPQSHTLYERQNLVLTRYPFVSFASIPAYFSHGYMDPLLEHRLLRKNRTLLAANIESAARKGALPAPDPAGTALLAYGTFHAVNDQHSTYYNLSPTLTLPAGERLALWLSPLTAPAPGYLQVLGQDVFREYILPDSGEISNRPRASRAFGTLPESPGVISLQTKQPGGEKPRITIILPKRPIDAGFDFARYELWRYDPDQLPVAVKSWMPYRLTVKSPEAAYVETPRLWLKGYRAEINGQAVPVERSPDNLAMFPVPAGTSEVTIRFIPPFLLGASYWLSLIGWTVLLPATIIWLRRRTPAANGPADANG